MDWGDLLTRWLDLAGFLLSLSIAIVLWVKDPRGRASRWFGVFLAARGIADLLAAFTFAATSHATALSLHHLMWVWRIIGVVALAIFLVYYPRQRAWYRPWMPWAVAIPGAVFFAFYMLRPDWLVTTTFDGRLVAEDARPLGWFVPLYEASTGLAALALFVSTQFMDDGPRRDVARLLTWGFWIFGAVRAGIYPLIVASHDVSALTPDEWIAYSTATLQTALFMAAVATPLLFIRHRGRRECLAYSAWFAIIAGMSFFAFGWANGLWGWEREVLPRTWMHRAGYIALPLITAYALLRHTLFDIPLRLKLAISGSSLVAGIGLGFWLLVTVLSEIVETLVGGAGPIPAILAGGLVAAVFKPMQGSTHRLADRLMPETKPFEEMDDGEREGFYARQQDLVDGEPEAEDILSRLRRRLDLAASMQRDQGRKGKGAQRA